MVLGYDDDSRNGNLAFRQESLAERGMYHHSSTTNSRTYPRPLERWERRLRDAKKDHRPRLRDWERERFGIEGSRASAAFEALSWNAGVQQGTRGMPRERREQLSPEEFWEHYERRRVPVVVSGIPSHEGWSAGERWTFERLDRRYQETSLVLLDPHLLLYDPVFVLLNDDSFRECKFKCGEDDDGYSVKVKLKYFLRYMERQKDDSPLYIFDSHFDDYDVSKRLLEDFRVPDYFPDDLFSMVGERRRPPYRWFLVGPKRSGTSVHIDPLGTSAWNTVIRGRKLWVLFPPRVDKRVAKGKDLVRDDEDDEPINYFVDILPRIRRKYGDSIDMYEFVQYPGETVFVPGGWHHAVLNLDDTIAVTQNFCSRNNFEKVWRKTRTGRKKMAVKWLHALEKEYPSLARSARRLNAEDGFTMSENRERRRRDGELDGDEQMGESKRNKKHIKRKSGSDGEDHAYSGSGNSSHKKGRRGWHGMDRVD